MQGSEARSKARASQAVLSPPEAEPRDRPAAWILSVQWLLEGCSGQSGLCRYLTNVQRALELRQLQHFGRARCLQSEEGLQLSDAHLNLSLAELRWFSQDLRVPRPRCQLLHARSESEQEVAPEPDPESCHRGKQAAPAATSPMATATDPPGPDR